MPWSSLRSWVPLVETLPGASSEPAAIAGATPMVRAAATMPVTSAMRSVDCVVERFMVPPRVPDRVVGPALETLGVGG